MIDKNNGIRCFETPPKGIHRAETIENPMICHHYFIVNRAIIIFTHRHTTRFPLQFINRKNGNMKQSRQLIRQNRFTTAGIPKHDYLSHHAPPGSPHSERA